MLIQIDTVFVKVRNLFVSHEMCQKREKREREAKDLFYFSHLNTFQLLFNLKRDILLSFSLTRPMRYRYGLRCITINRGSPIRSKYLNMVTQIKIL